MGFIFGEGSLGMLFAGGALILVMYLYTWFANPRLAIDLTQGFAKVVVFLGTIIFKIVYGIMKWIIELFSRLFGGRR